MQSSAGNIRKAAILVASLDRRTADALLDQMPPAQADLVRRAAMEIDVVDPDEQEAVLGEFLGGQPESPADDGGVELAGALAGERLEALEQRFPAPPVEPFRCLRQSDARELSPVLGEEHPQTIAMIVSHLPRERAAPVLAGLPSATQAEVLRRLVDLEETAPEIVRDVERGLESRIAQRSQTVRPRTGGLSVVADLLGAADPSLARELVANLRQHDPELANRVSRYEFEFDDLSQLADVSLRRLIAAANPQTLLLALAAASPHVLDRFRRQLPGGHWRVLEQAWRALPPTSLADIEAAQAELVSLAEELDRAGRLELPRHFRAQVA